MNKQEFTERVQAIDACTDDVQRRELLAALIEDGGKDYDDHAAAVTARDQAQQDNEALREANMKLFKRIGDHKDPDPIVKTEEKKEPRKFADLFNEKGGIK